MLTRLILSLLEIQLKISALIVTVAILSSSGQIFQDNNKSIPKLQLLKTVSNYIWNDHCTMMIKPNNETILSNVKQFIGGITISISGIKFI